MEDILIKKIKRLSYFCMYADNLEEHKFSGIIEGILEFERSLIIQFCDDLFLFILYGLAKSEQSKDILNFLNEYSNRKFQYKFGTGKTVRFLYLANQYLKKIKYAPEKTPYVMGNIFGEFQLK